jgi:hypothetical protein
MFRFDESLLDGATFVVFLGLGLRIRAEAEAKAADQLALR